MEQDNNMYQPPTPPSSYQPDDTAVMSTKDWLIMLLIFMIPCVGLVMSFVWAFGSTGNLNRRNYCRAYLIMMAIAFGLMLLFYIFLFAVIGATAFMW